MNIEYVRVDELYIDKEKVIILNKKIKVEEYRKKIHRYLIPNEEGKGWYIRRDIIEEIIEVKGYDIEMKNIEDNIKDMPKYLNKELFGIFDRLKKNNLFYWLYSKANVNKLILFNLWNQDIELNHALHLLESAIKKYIK